MGKGVKIITETKEDEVVLLKNVDVDFVSLVRHGANQTPFRVVKNEGTRRQSEMKVIQAILLPKDVELKDLAEKQGLEWLSEAKVEKVESFDEYKKIVQIPEEQFNPESLQMVKLHENGTFAMIGALTDEKAAKGALTLGEVNKDIEIQASPMDQAIAESPRPAFVLTFRDMFEKELHSFLDVVRGALNQSQADSKKRKSSVMGALDSFKSFLAIGLDALAKSGAKKEEAGEIIGLDEALKKILSAIKSEGGTNEMELFKTPEEFVEAVTKVMDARDAKKAEAEKEAADKVAADKAVADNAVADKVAADKAAAEKAAAEKDAGKTGAEKAAEKEAAEKEAVKKAKAEKAAAEKDGDKVTVEKLSKRIEELENQLAGQPAGAEIDDELTPKNKKNSPFAGMFSNFERETELQRHAQ